MFNFPLFRFPYYNYYPYYNNYINNGKNTSSLEKQNFQDKNDEKIKDVNEPEKNEFKNKNIKGKRSFKYNSFGPINFINPFIEDLHEDEPIVEILGLQLYLDDLIIIGLLFLLYKEDVQDEMLFLALILLLIS